MSSLQEQCETLFAKAIKDKVAPGLQYCVFDKDKLLAHGACGYAKLPDPQTGQGGRPMDESTICWMASCSKLGLSLIVLHILDKGLAVDGSTIADLDDPLATLRLLPELDPSSTANVSKLITGWDGIDTETGKVRPILVPRKTVPTLRQLLAHTGGQSYFWDELIVPWYAPKGRGKPLADMPFSGRVSDFDCPSVNEAGLAWKYGPSSDWLGQWAVRATGKSLRQLYRDILFRPLGCSDTLTDLWLSPETKASSTSGMFTKTADGAFVEIPFDVWSCPGYPPEGYAHFASAAVWSPLCEYIKLFQACMYKDSRILTGETWDMALGDNLTPFDIPTPAFIASHGRPDLAWPVKHPSPGGDETASLLSTFLTRKKADTGKPKGSHSWFGLANTYFAFNGEHNIGYAFGGQVLPFAAPEWAEVKADFETIVFKGPGKLTNEV